MTPKLQAVSLTSGFSVDSYGDLWDWLNDPRKPNFDDFGAKSPGQFCDEMELRSKIETIWSIRSEDLLIGYLGFVKYSPVSGQFHGLVLHPEFRGRGIGSLAVREAVCQLLTRGFTKVMASFFSDNDPVRSVFEKCGFEREGYLRAATKRDGHFVDMLVYSYTEGGR